MKKIVDFIFAIGIITISVLVFINRERIVDLGEIGYFSAFILAFISNVSVFLPAPSLMVVVAYSQVLSPVLIAIVCALGTTLGECSGYLFGSSVNNISSKWNYFIERLSKWIKNIYIFVFVLALLPLPLFDFVGVYAGSKKVKIVNFFLVCYLGKMIKMMFYAIVISGYIKTIISF